MANKKVKKVRIAKTARYFKLGDKAGSFSDAFTGVVCTPLMIGVLLKGKPQTSELLANALSNHHIEEINLEEVAKLKKDGWKEYGNHPGGHAHKMEFSDGAAKDKLKEISELVKDVNKPKVEDDEDLDDEDEELEEDEELDEDTNEDTDEDMDDDDTDGLDSTSAKDLKKLVKDSEDIPEEEKSGYSTLGKDKLIELIRKYQ